MSIILMRTRCLTNKIILPIIFLAFILAFSFGTVPSFASEHDDSPYEDRDDDSLRDVQRHGF